MDDSTDGEPIASEGRYAVVDAADDEAADYRFVVDGDGSVPLAADELGDAATVLERAHRARNDPEGTGAETDAPDGVELTCHDCGKTWTYTGDDEHASCPNCETEVPVEGIGP